MLKNKYEYKIESLDLDAEYLDREFFEQQMKQMAADGWHIAAAGKKHQVWEREVVDDVQEDDHSADENNPSRMDLEDSVPFDELKPGEIYEGYPKDSSGICERVIFCPKTIFHKDGLVITRFSVYEEFDGGVLRYKMQVYDPLAETFGSREADRCACAVYKLVGQNFRAMPCHFFKFEDRGLLDDLLHSAGLCFSEKGNVLVDLRKNRRLE